MVVGEFALITVVYDVLISLNFSYQTKNLSGFCKSCTDTQVEGLFACVDHSHAFLVY